MKLRGQPGSANVLEQNSIFESTKCQLSYKKHSNCYPNNKPHHVFWLLNMGIPNEEDNELSLSINLLPAIEILSAPIPKSKIICLKIKLKQTIQNKTKNPCCRQRTSQQPGETNQPTKKKKNSVCWDTIPKISLSLRDGT